MRLAPPRPTDTRSLFRPLSTELVCLLRALPPDHWQRPTIAGAWLVRDVVAHLVDLMLRRLSCHRDAMSTPPPARPIGSDREFVAFVNERNAQWVAAARRLSPRVLTELAEWSSRDLADWFEQVPIDAPAPFGVSWAGEQTSVGWFDLGREYAELWHHQQQIRMAVGAPLLVEPAYLRAALEIAVRALPRAYRDLHAEPGDTIVIEVTGEAGGTWTLWRSEDRWRLAVGAPPEATTRMRLSDDTAWRLFFHARPGPTHTIQVTGAAELAVPLRRARAVDV